MKAWRSGLKEIEAILERHESAFDGFRKIDDSIAKSNESLSTVIKSAAQTMAGIVGASSFTIYLSVGERVFALEPEMKADAKKLFNSLNKNIEVQSSNTSPMISKHRNSWRLCLAFKGQSLLHVWLRGSSDEIDTEEANSLLGTFATQLQALISHVLFRDLAVAKQKAYEIFFDSNLKPSKSWDRLLDTLTSFLPCWPELASVTPKIRQLLLFTEGELSLRIAAGNGFDGANYVLVENSVCGLLIKDRKVKYLLDDPRTHGALYMGYDKGITKELAVRLEHNGEAVGVVNIEHSDDRLFHSLYVEGILEASVFIAPLVAALQSRYESYRRKEIGLLYVFTDLLSRMGDTYGHHVQQPITGARMAANDLRSALSRPEINKERLEVLVGRIINEVGLIEQHSNDFTQGLPEFISYGAQPVQSKIQKRLSSLSKLEELEKIAIEIRPLEPVLLCFASSLFQEHVFNVVNNSIQQIRKQKLDGLMKSGSIKIDVRKLLGETKESQKTGINFIEISISDNGGGARAGDLKSIGKPTFTTKGAGGSGFGVAAAVEYFESIGGRMTWKNAGKGFKTTILVQEYDAVVHKEDRFIDRIRRIASK